MAPEVKEKQRKGPLYARSSSEVQVGLNLKDLGAKLGKDDRILRIGKSIYPIKSDIIKNPGRAINEVTGYISEKRGLKPIKANYNEIARIHDIVAHDIEGNRYLSKNLTNFAIVALSITSIVLSLSNFNITGNVISTATTRTSGIGITLCVLGILGLAIFKNQKPKRFLKEISNFK